MIETAEKVLFVENAENFLSRDNKYWAMKRNIYFGFILRLRSKPIKSSWKTQTCSSQLKDSDSECVTEFLGKRRSWRTGDGESGICQFSKGSTYRRKANLRTGRAVRMAAETKELPSFPFAFSWRRNHHKTGLLGGSGGSGNAALGRGQGISSAQWMKQTTSNWILMADEVWNCMLAIPYVAFPLYYIFFYLTGRKHAWPVCQLFSAGQVGHWKWTGM